MYPRIKVNFKRLRKNLFAISEIIKKKGGCSLTMWCFKVSDSPNFFY